MKLIHVTKAQQLALAQVWANEAKSKFKALSKSIAQQKYVGPIDGVEVFVISGKSILTMEGV